MPTLSIGVWPCALRPSPGTVTKWSSTRARVVARVMHEHEAARARSGERALRDPRDEGGRDAGVDGVAALGQHLGPRLGGERMSCCDGATHHWKATAGGPISSSCCRDAEPAVVQREATLAAGAAASLAAALVWLGPPGSDLAEHAYQRTLS